MIKIKKKAKFEFKPTSAIYYLGERSLTSLSSSKTSGSLTITAGVDGGGGGGSLLCPFVSLLRGHGGETFPNLPPQTFLQLTSLPITYHHLMRLICLVMISPHNKDISPLSMGSFICSTSCCIPRDWDISGPE